MGRSDAGGWGATGWQWRPLEELVCAACFLEVSAVGGGLVDGSDDGRCDDDGDVGKANQEINHKRSPFARYRSKRVSILIGILGGLIKSGSEGVPSPRARWGDGGGVS
jgi:hypothetical protein